MATSRSVLHGVPIAMAACLLVACGGDEPAATDSTQLSQEDPVSILVGTLPIPDNAPLFLAIQEGYFEEEGLQVETQMVAGGSAALPAMVAGDLQFSSSNWTTVLQAASQGLPAQMVWEMTGPKEGVNGIMVAGSAPYQSPADLRGQRVAVNTLAGLVELQVRECMAANGLQEGDYELVEIPFPDMPAAVQQGNVAAAFIGEPFTTLAEDQGARVIAEPSTCSERLAEMPVIGFMTTSQYSAENPEVTAAFARALERGAELAESDPQQVIDILPTYTQLTPELAGRMTLPAWLEDRAPSTDRAEVTQEAMIDFGFIDEPVEDLEALIAPVD
ncbi:ABC transporter substrate-binding protein [Geodermatophilus sabuli]|uniref:NitT/TauT family transport system substrate-binding protein n=1 Tax=Geodermatophilus sabuli TaxID=1564158 RepID=A0A285EBA8_9ACTN|nr:ABC transporter substrate-binding protein [Geodermatophilus sabuli]MBB3084341.1 NitT/TauT family transport system substrate-binding protein [Geodermatophilus sabuli]SNX96389.1 NitT/TauT family transport system substrate-binding protein [Geodermatophilus sabuli]